MDLYKELSRMSMPALQELRTQVLAQMPAKKIQTVVDLKEALSRKKLDQDQLIRADNMLEMAIRNQTRVQQEVLEQQEDENNLAKLLQSEALATIKQKAAELDALVLESTRREVTVDFVVNLRITGLPALQITEKPVSGLVLSDLNISENAVEELYDLSNFEISCTGPDTLPKMILSEVEDHLHDINRNDICIDTLMEFDAIKACTALYNKCYMLHKEFEKLCSDHNLDVESVAEHVQ